MVDELVDAGCVRRGRGTGNATFETEVPDRRKLDSTWLPEHR